MGCIETRCGKCKSIFEVDDSILGRTIECPDCGTPFVIIKFDGSTVDFPSFPQINHDRDFSPGEIIFGLYEIKDKPIKGGMGKVYRAFHHGWNMELAIKQPLAKYFKNEDSKLAFTRECETWINLGFHPHIVSCYYVRELNGVPSIFAEWMDGGSLSQWIKSEKLYEGGGNKVVRRILDIAIQSAWGLHYAHEKVFGQTKGIIHQDVKPDNVLLASDGTVKIADFGIAGAKKFIGIASSASLRPDGTMVGECGAYTMAYCAPEQRERRLLTRRCDIFSWAISMLEVCIGGRLWEGSSIVAQMEFDTYIGNPIVPLPEALVKLLRECLMENEAERPHTMKDAADRLTAIYRETLKEDYFRSEPKAADLQADGLNNQGVSLVDLGMHEDAERRFDAALRTNPLHPEAAYNRGLLLWRSARLTDLDLLRQMEECINAGGETDRGEFALSLIQIERGDAESALKLLEGLKRKNPDNTEIVKALELVRSEFGSLDKCLWIIKGHEGQVESVAFSPDGRYAISAGGDETLRLWEVSGKRHLKTFEGHAGTVNSVTFSPDGRHALSGSGDRTLRLWDVNGGNCTRVFEGHSGNVNSVAFSPDGRHALSGSGDWTLRLWDVNGGNCTRVFEGHSGNVNFVAFTPDGCSAVSGSYDKTLRLWNLSSGTSMRTFEGHTDCVNSISVSSDGLSLLSGSFDKTLRLWKISDGRCLRTFIGHSDRIHSVAFSPDGCFAFSGGCDNMPRLWEVISGRCLLTLKERISCNSIAFNPRDGRFVLSGNFDGTLCLLDVSTGPAQPFIAVKPRKTNDLSLFQGEWEMKMEMAQSSFGASDISKALANLRSARSIQGYETEPRCMELWAAVGRRCRKSGFRAGWFLRKMEGHLKPVTSVAFSYDRRYVLSGSYDASLRLWDISNTECLRTFDGHSKPVTSAAISTDGRFALSGSHDMTLRLWGVSNGKCLGTFLGHCGTVRSVAFSPDNQWAISGGEDRNLLLWDIASGRRLRTFMGHGGGINSVAFSHDGRCALSGSDDKTLFIWDVLSGKCLRKFEGHLKTITSAAFSPEDQSVLTGSRDGTIRLWNVSDGKCLRIFEGHSCSVASVAFSPDGQYALSGGKECGFRLWNISSGKCLRVFAGHTERINSVAFSPEGRFALSGSSDRTLRLWELDWELEFPGWNDWDDGVSFILRNFLTAHTPYAGGLPHDRNPSEDEIYQALKRRGSPFWVEGDFQKLLRFLSFSGYGWLRPEGVRSKLEEFAAISA